ncbi:MAG: CRISPR-associated endonuclease Cas3'' [Nitrospira sp. LK70]|nr:CRISPR-associated endonuclease Cas3'' [Nitrospira sp. LK70]
MSFWAHSPKLECGIPAQTYSEHIENVRRNAVKHAQAAGAYSAQYGVALQEGAGLAAEYHDLGKLDPDNQAILACEAGKLPINHVDAGTAYLLQDKTTLNTFAGLLVYAHHRGLPGIPSERAKGIRFLRDEKLWRLTEERLADYVKAHRAIVSQRSFPSSASNWSGLSPQVARMALSCLVDADHSDTARHYGYPFPSVMSPLYETALARLAALDGYVKALSFDKSEPRTQLRGEIYQACRDASTALSIYACDSPVGTGKTTAVMAHLLKAVAAKHLRRIFVVLPFTNIIDQSVDIYRRSIALPGENPIDVVAAHHHRVEFEDWRSRQHSFLWHAPIVVTTAVQFFETLASNQTSALRKLHQVAGSAIYIDEAHAALPSYLWPQGWRWLKELVRDWSCHVVMGSGSLTRFWELEDFADPPEKLSELVPESLRSTAASAETSRIHYLSKDQPMNLDELISWIHKHPGPRLLILNTVQSTAMVANAIHNRHGRQCVEHLSTSLSPFHRKRVLERIKTRLEDKQDVDWTLVATSCVEAGMDFSFRTCLRERCGLISLIQTAGRGNRSGEYGQIEIWDFQLVHSELLPDHPSFKTSAKVLLELFHEGKVAASYSREALRREIRQEGMKEEAAQIIRAEQNQEFPIVEERFKVIDTATVTVVVDESVKRQLEEGNSVAREELQLHSVQIWGYRTQEWGLVESRRYPGLLLWNMGYDDFLGYMKGVLELNEFKMGNIRPI